ncbi:MAG: hypothetical protein RLZZ467_741, partial [Gemmatimonadota bacterium]
AGLASFLLAHVAYVVGFLVVSPGSPAPVVTTVLVILVSSVIIGLAADVGLVLITAWLLPARRIPWRSIVPGAAVAALGLSLARLAGAQVLAHLVLQSSSVYGSIGTFFALLLWMLVIGYILTVAAFVEVTAWTRRHGTITREIEVPAPR